MGKYHAYAYISIFWSLRYVFPILFLILASISIIIKIRALFIFSFLLLFADFIIYWVIKRPKKIVSAPVASRYANNKKSDFLLLVSIDNIRKSSKDKRFSLQDWSFAWVNVLLQEAGTFSVADIKDFKAGSRRVIILSKSVGDDLTKNTVGKLQEFVKKGGILILEKPSNTLEPLSGARFDGTYHSPVRISGISERYKGYNILKEMPLFTRLHNMSHKGGIEALVHFDGKPSVLKRRHGKGAVITICFDFGLQLTSMQQGKPLDNYAVKDKTSLKDICESQDLILDKALEHNDHPFADILEKFVFEVIEEQQPIPRLWYLKDNYTGALIMSHDEDYFGDKMAYMIEHEKRISSKSTFFIAPSQNMSEKTAGLLDDGNEFALHWDRMPYSLHSIFRSREDDGKSLREQIKMLESGYGKKILSNRNHFLKWDSHYTNTFRLLYKNNIKVDSSYGPNSGKGYLFGTGFPFFPLDTNGNMIPVLEMPFHIQEVRGGVTADYIEKLIAENKEKYHGLLVLLFHPQKSLPGRKSRQVWLRSYTLAKRNKQLITNFREFYEFFNERENAVLTSGFDNNKLSIKIESDGKTIMVPVNSGFKRLKNVKMDGLRKDYSSVSIINSGYCMVNIPEGRHSLEIIYR